MSFDKATLYQALDVRVRGNAKQSCQIIEQLAEESHTDVREVTQAVDGIQRKLLQALRPGSMSEGSNAEYASARYAALEICKKDLGIDTVEAIELCDRVIDDFFAQ